MIPVSSSSVCHQVCADLAGTVSCTFSSYILQINASLEMSLSLVSDQLKNSAKLDSTETKGDLAGTGGC